MINFHRFPYKFSISMTPTVSNGVFAEISAKLSTTMSMAKFAQIFGYKFAQLAPRKAPFLHAGS